ncbi:hypothetical protein [Agaribacterium haliotis]|uniref:hypothetical protein n=1 Tax=Agaribacterium haliotis TaxID=2013869 RepID=UPI000BB5648F|nr:hypothetical protein [Agaribacterium haliotis]
MTISQQAVEAISENLNDLIKQQYQYAQNNRSDEYAAYNDFKDRFIEKNSDTDVLAAFGSCAERLNNNELKGLFWLASSYNIQLFRVIPDVIQSVNDDEKLTLLEYYFRKTDGLSDVDIGIDPVLKASLEKQFDLLK